nr:vinorine synthase-like [Ipomoea batatas]
MKVEVRSKEIVKPFSPTPESLKKYKLSFLDQFALNVRVPFVFFYHSSGAYSHDGHTNTIDELKKSLSKTLSLMYPLAGRVKEDKVAIECNDEGVEFIVADVAEIMSCLLENPEMEKIKQLIPTGKVYEPQPVGKALVAVQVNRFSCGGIAIGFFVSHAVLDGSTLAKFLEIWASFNRGLFNNGGIGSGFISNHSTILFPPLTDTSALERSAKMAAEAIQQEEKHMVVKRFLIPANALAQLREELICKENNKGLRRPSRTEAITALVWAAVINATPPTQTVPLSCMVDLRGRMEPPLPPNCLGNLTYGATAHCEAAKDGAAVTAAQLVEKIRDSLRAVNDGAARKMYGEGGLLRAAFARGHEMVRNKDCSTTTLYTSSLCRMPYYEVDFGWGKPRLVVNMVKNFMVLLLDASNGAVEVWMGLPKQLMHTLTQDRHFLAYVSASPKPKL